MGYYVITSKITGRIIATRAFDEAYGFIKENHDAKAWYMDSSPKIRYMDKRRFLKHFYQNSDRGWADRIKVFEMAEIMINNEGDRNALFSLFHIGKDYRKYKKIMEAKL